jgi:hypothetical protein
MAACCEFDTMIARVEADVAVGRRRNLTMRSSAMIRSCDQSS